MDIRKEMLPIGSVVLLKNAERRLMIIGVKGTNVTDDGKEQDYDYMGVVYPQGYMGADTVLMFNHQDIDKYYSRGFEDDERARFVDWLAQVYEQQEK